MYTVVLGSSHIYCRSIVPAMRLCAISSFTYLRCGVGSEKIKNHCVPEVPSAEPAK